MTARTRVFVGILLVYALGVGVLMWRLLADIDPRYRESAEESLVETAHLVAAMVEQRSGSGVPLDTAWLEPLFRDVYARRFEANIFGVKKESVELRATVVDANGIVVFD
jgi:two-component system sensor histidine kinase CreC